VSVNNQVRFYGNGVRTSLLSIYNAHGDALGGVVATRYAWEAGQVIAEIHGPRRAAEAFYRLGDLITGGDYAPASAPEIERPPAPAPAKAWWARISWTWVLVGFWIGVLFARLVHA
jgi:hypothetical protein